MVLSHQSGATTPDNLDDLRHIEGFPTGEDEDLLALSEPPHYTAYPDPHIAKFIANWGMPAAAARATSSSIATVLPSSV